MVKVYKYLLFLLGALCGPMQLRAEAKIDYDKPYDEIREQMSSFDSRHSLMPVEEKSESMSKIKDDVSDDESDFNQGRGYDKFGVDDVANVKVKDTKDVARENVATRKKTKNISNADVGGDVKEEAPIILKRPKRLSDDADFKTIVVNGENSGVDDEPKLGEVLKPNMRLDSTTGEWVKDNNDDVPSNVVKQSVPQKIVSPVINERADSVVSKPLFAGKDRAWVQSAIREARANANANVNASVKADASANDYVRGKKSDDGGVAKGANVRKVEAIAERSNVAMVPNVAMEEIAMVHVASYKDEKTANNGVRVLREKYAIAAELPAVVQYENTGKGWYYRLYFTGHKDLVEKLCREIKSGNGWCRVL